MRAVVRRGARLELDAGYPEPAPGPGQVVVRTLACGICGSDLHALHHLDHLAAAARRSGAATTLDASKDLVFGHEFCAEVVDFGPGCSRNLKLGARVVSVPAAAGPGGMELVGFSHRYPGGYGEYMALQEALLIEVPGGLSTEAAATTEPFAVGAHAVARADPDADHVALVVGCGPVGLAVITALKARGMGPIIASDYSAERRRAAERLGADVIVDPGRDSPHAHWSRLGVTATLSDAALAAMTGRTGKQALIFECVGAPGIIQSLIEQGPPGARIVVVGVCQVEDRFEPSIAINKQVGLDFVFGYTPAEFEATLRLLADGRIDASTVLSGEVGLEGVAPAFERLSCDPSWIKVLVKP